jgi:hypothetical protein
VKSRDEIIELVRPLRFSSRQCFYSVLDQLSIVKLESGEVVHLKWPEALGEVTVEQWNHAYDSSMAMCTEMIGYTAPGGQPVQ